MAKNAIPHALEMRELKYGSAPEERRDAVAAALRAAGRHPEALLLYEGRGTHPFVAEEVRHGVETGNAYLLLIARKMGATVPDDLLRACAARAEAAGRWLDARQCWKALGDEAALQRIAPNLPEGLRPPPPLPPAVSESA